MPRKSETPPPSSGIADRKKHILRWAGILATLIGLGIWAIWFAHGSSWFVALGLVAVGCAAGVVLWKVPQWQVGGVRGLDSKERFDRVNEARKTLATVLGGAALLAGFYGTWLNLKVAQDTAKVAQESSDTSQKALLVAQEGQITDRFTKAIEQLGKPELDVRLGGIYSLEAIANESEDFHWPIMEVLCTYVREHAPVTRKDQGEQPETKQLVSADIQAILTVLGRRNRKYEKSTEDLSLSGAYLPGADLREAHLGRAHLILAYLSGANLIDAHLGGANLTKAQLSGAYLNGADLRGAYLSGADLSNAKHLTQVQIDEAYGDSTTKLPANLHMPDSWKK